MLASYNNYYLSWSSCLSSIFISIEYYCSALFFCALAKCSIIFVVFFRLWVQIVSSSCMFEEFYSESTDSLLFSLSLSWNLCFHSWLCLTERFLISFVSMTFIWSLLINFISSNDDHLFYWIFSSSINVTFSMSEWELCLRADSVISYSAALTMKKLSKRMTDKQTAEQSAENDQLSVQMLISSKMSKKLAQFFVNKSDKILSSFKIKLEVLMFESESELLSKESDWSDNHDNNIVSHVSQKADSESEFKDEISNEEVLKILKKWIKKQVKSSVKKSASDSSSSDSSSSSDESDHWFCKKCSKHYCSCCYEMNSDSDFDISLKYQKVKITSLKLSDDYVTWESSMKIMLMCEDTLKLVKNKLKKLKNSDKSHYK